MDSDFTSPLDPILTTSNLPDFDVIDNSSQAVPLSLVTTRPTSSDVANTNLPRRRGFISRVWFTDDGQPLDGAEGQLIDDEAGSISLDSSTTLTDIVPELSNGSSSPSLMVRIG